jgi:hypothetical protein
MEARVAAALQSRLAAGDMYAFQVAQTVREHARWTLVS